MTYLDNDTIINMIIYAFNTKVKHLQVLLIKITAHTAFIDYESQINPHVLSNFKPIEIKNFQNKIFILTRVKFNPFVKTWKKIIF